MSSSGYASRVQRSNIMAENVKNITERVQHHVPIIMGKNPIPAETQNLNREVDFALLSKKAYEKDVRNRAVEGLEILPQYTTTDRTVYRHEKSGKVIVAFRGTDVHDWGKRGSAKSFFQSRGFRDVTSDMFLAVAGQDLSHRFRNAERVTADLVQKFGRENVIATGHSLGGSQALHVSKVHGVHAEVYNPHIDWRAAATHENYYNAGLHVNISDPVAALYPWTDYQYKDVRYNRKASFGLGQHGIENFIRPPKLVPKEEPKLNANGIRSFMNRPEGSMPVVEPRREMKHGGNCSKMPLYLQIQYGCRQIPVR